MPLRRMARGLHPGTQSGDHGLFNKCRWRFTPVFPRKIVVPVAPPRITRAFRTLFARQAKIADGNETPRRPLGGPVAIGESVKLFDITERMTSLPLDPIPQPGLQGAVIQFEGARRQCGAIADGHDPRLAIGNGRQHRDQIDCQAGRDERRRSILQSHRLISFANSRDPLLISSRTTAAVEPSRPALIISNAALEPVLRERTLTEVMRDGSRRALRSRGELSVSRPQSD